VSFLFRTKYSPNGVRRSADKRADHRDLEADDQTASTGESAATVGIHGAVYCFHETFFEVGVHTRFHYMVSYGMGDPWDAAFADAARRSA
jgi:hypothetical protein